MSTISSKVYFNTFPPKPSSAQKKALYYQKQFSTGALQLIIAILYFHPWVICAEKDACKKSFSESVAVSLTRRCTECT